MDKYGEQLKSSIGDSSLPDKTKEQLRQFARQMKEWKAYQLYSKKLSSFKNKIGALDEIRGRDFGNLAQQISDVDTISGSSSADKLIGQMRQQALPEDDKLLRDAEELLKLKKVMLVSKESGQLRKRLEDSGQNMDEPPELESALNAVEESRDWQEIAEKISKLLERLREGDYPQIPKEVKDILGMKLEDLIKESTDSLKEQIRESKLPDSGAELLQQLEKMDSESERKR